MNKIVRKMKTLKNILSEFDSFLENDYFRILVFLILCSCILFSSFSIMTYHIDNYLYDKIYILMDARIFLYLLVYVCFVILCRMIVHVGYEFIIAFLYVLLFGICCRSFAARSYFTIIKKEGLVVETTGTVDNVFKSSGRYGTECTYWYTPKDKYMFYFGSFKVPSDNKPNVGDKIRVVYSKSHPRISRAMDY